MSAAIPFPERPASSATYRAEEAAEAARHIPATPEGLTAAEAASRLSRDGPNLLPANQPASRWVVVRKVLTEPMFLMLLTAGGIYLVLGSRGEALFLLAFVLAVIGLTLVQEGRTQRALDALRDLSAPKALVQRDGVAVRVPGTDVVVGDWLLLQEGDRVAADAELCSGSVSLDESLLTGEALPVEKQPATGQPDDPVVMVFASTVVTRGHGGARVTEVAANTAVGRIGGALNATVEPPSQLQQASRKLVRQLGVVAVGLSAALVLLGVWWDGRPLLDSLLSGIALAMAILPEEIPVILTVFLALGAWRLAGQKVLTRRSTAVEALGAITVLAVDKTGTLTRNQMAVVALAAAGEPLPLTDGAPLPPDLVAVLQAAVLATPPRPFDPMEQALRACGSAPAQGLPAWVNAAVPLHAYALAPGLLAMTQVHQGPDERQWLACKGAPEAVADLCRLTETQRVHLRSQVASMAGLGWRVLGVAGGHWPPEGDAASTPPDWPAGQADLGLSWLGLVALADPPRDDVPAALAECRGAGVRVIMLTGDHPATASAIATQVGLTDRPEVLTGAQIDTLSDADLTTRMARTDVCARLQPAHKLRLVRCLQAGGAVVAMTGDGVNDAPALKAADVGIAMGLRGTDVAREASALVLLDDSFARIVAAIRQGRRIFDNIDKASRFTFAVHVPIVGLALLPALMHWPALLLPAHIVLLELLIDPACSVVFEAEPPADGVMQRPPRAPGVSPFSSGNLWAGALQGSGLALVLLAGFAVLQGPLGVPEAASRGAVVVALLSSVWLLVVANRQPDRGWWPSLRAGNPWLWPMAGAVAALLVLALSVPVLRDLLHLAPVTPVVAGAAALMVVLNCFCLALTRLWRPSPAPAAPIRHTVTRAVHDAPA
ncbi:cation-translocating P-type ATPase [Ideonella margarita]|uniref:Cation-translocating P-type ATPase n=1 Tax=Ideonella margarita TaxID=2984191 RepID=A0ABU9C5R7_9BURK